MVIWVLLHRQLQLLIWAGRLGLWLSTSCNFKRIRSPIVAWRLRFFVCVRLGLRDFFCELLLAIFFPDFVIWFLFFLQGCLPWILLLWKILQKFLIQGDLWCDFFLQSEINIGDTSWSGSWFKLWYWFVHMSMLLCNLVLLWFAIQYI